MGYDTEFAFRLTSEDLQKLRALAEATGRTPTAVLRLLIRAAALTGKRDITLSKGAAK